MANETNLELALAAAADLAAPLNVPRQEQLVDQINGLVGDREWDHSRGRWAMVWPDAVCDRAREPSDSPRRRAVIRARREAGSP